LYAPVVQADKRDPHDGDCLTMHTVHKTPHVTVSQRGTGELEADLLAIPVFEDDTFADEPDLDPATAGDVSAAHARKEFRGTLYEVFQTHATRGGWKTPRLLLIGAGKRQDCTPDRLRRLATTAGLAARQRRAARLALVHRPLPGLAAGRAVEVLAEGVTLANFEGASFKSVPDTSWLAAVELRVGGAAGDYAAHVSRGLIMGECTNVARTMANEPGNRLTPRLFAERGAALAAEAGLKVDVLDETRIAALNMGMLLGVTRGSQEPPRLLVLEYQPAQPRPGVTLALIGRGITFDTGGISIKPAENMDKMKDDMSGGAAVIGAMLAVARLRAPVRCLGLVPMSENMPDGLAFKPGDVLTSAEGKTVEILNTDAEGRLVLGDALWYARQLGATHLVDVATLTGACVVALGKTTTGLFGTPSSWVNTVHAASEVAGDRSWPMPVFEDYFEQLKSEIADFTNTGGRAGGAITAALFIKEFAGGLPWVHMDIAGTAWAEENKPYQPKGATGVAVRTLAELALAAGTWSAGGTS
jgi:leucyl aminopeptidase